MENHELERLLRENLKLARENNDYLIRIDRRQRWERNWRALYWAVLLAFAAFGTYYAFPYLKEARDTAQMVWQSVSQATSFTQPTVER